MSSRKCGVARALAGILPLAATLAGGASALPLLSEVYYDAPGSDDGQSFVELAGVPGASLDGYWIEGINGSNGASGPSIALAGLVGADGLFVLADSLADGTTLVSGADLLANFDFQNGPDSVVLRLDDVIVDALGYGEFAPGEFFAGEGSPAPDVAAGSSLARVYANLDTNDNALDFRALEMPSPGVASFTPVPEPGSALLLGLGLAGLTTASGKRRSGAVRSGGGR